MIAAYLILGSIIAGLSTIVRDAMGKPVLSWLEWCWVTPVIVVGWLPLGVWLAWQWWRAK